MELPYGFTIDEVKEIVNKWNVIYDDLENNRIDLRKYDDKGCSNFDEYYEDDEYIDRYIQDGTTEFCISSEKFENKETWLSETIVVAKDLNNPIHLFIEDFEEMIKGYE